MCTQRFVFSTTTRKKKPEEKKNEPGPEENFPRETVSLHFSSATIQADLKELAAEFCRLCQDPSSPATPHKGQTLLFSAWSSAMELQDNQPHGCPRPRPQPKTQRVPTYLRVAPEVLSQAYLNRRASRREEAANPLASARIRQKSSSEASAGGLKGTRDVPTNFTSLLQRLEEHLKFHTAVKKMVER